MEYILVSACLLGARCRYDGAIKEYNCLRPMSSRENW